jgi:hypothetical protein
MRGGNWPGMVISALQVHESRHWRYRADQSSRLTWSRA